MNAVRVLIYGVSLMLAVIEASLRELPNFTLLHVDPSVPSADEEVCRFHPHIVITDGYGECTVVCPTRVLRVDPYANNQAVVVDGQIYPIHHTAELAQIIHEFACE